MNPTNSAFHAAAYADGLSPQIVEHVNDDEMYVGYCTPDCTAYDAPRWLIKHIVRSTSGIQTIFFSEGSRLFNKRWSERKNYKYKPTEKWEDVSDEVKPEDGE